MGLERGVESGWRASSRDHDKFPKGRFSRSFNLAGICSYFFSFKSICPCAKALLKKHCWLNHSPRTEAKRKHRCNSSTRGTGTEPMKPCKQGTQFTESSQFFSGDACPRPLPISAAEQLINQRQKCRDTVVFYWAAWNFLASNGQRGRLPACR